ncbi:MAG: ABC transporter substrate-binding protein [Burkholderiaceae bacterium]|jgi:sulfonate transport system substrate-binding protein|nr:ABC transporter substrate-binding protein [Burkholderiaceae bacterium]
MSIHQLLHAGIAALAIALSPAIALAQQQPELKNARLVISYQDPAFPALIRKSGVLDGAAYTVEWVLLNGPAANLSALYAGNIDLGHMGDTSLTLEQANAPTAWTPENAPLRIVAGWRNAHSRAFPRLTTAVRTSANISSVQDIQGKKFGYNYGGVNHAQYLATLVQAGLTEKQIEPVKFNDSPAAAAGFNAGRVDVYAGGLGPVLTSIRSGAGRILLTDRDTGIPAMSVWTATSKVLKDPLKVAALQDYFGRLSGYWAWHRSNKAVVIDVLKSSLKITDERAAFEYEVRGGSFVKFDTELLAQEQKIADILFDGRAIKKKVDVRIGYDPQFNAAQKAIDLASAVKDGN